MGLFLNRIMQDVLHKGGGGGSAGATQDENGLHEGGEGAGGQTQAQDSKFLRASILPRFLIPGRFRWVCGCGHSLRLPT